MLGSDRFIVQIVEADARSGDATSRAVDRVVVAEGTDARELRLVSDRQVTGYRSIGVAAVGGDRSLWVGIVRLR